MVTCGDSKRTWRNLYYAFPALLPNGERGGVWPGSVSEYEAFPDITCISKLTCRASTGSALCPRFEKMLVGIQAEAFLCFWVGIFSPTPAWGREWWMDGWMRWKDGWDGRMDRWCGMLPGSWRPFPVYCLHVVSVRWFILCNAFIRTCRWGWQEMMSDDDLTSKESRWMNMNRSIWKSTVSLT